MFLPECAHEPLLLEIMFVWYLENLHNLCLVQCSCENARLCSLVWVFVACIHETIRGQNSNWIQWNIPPFSVGPVHYRFGLIYLLTIFIVNVSKIMITYYHLKALIPSELSLGFWKQEFRTPIWQKVGVQGFFSAFWEHDPTPRIRNFRVVLYKIGKKHTL